MDVRHTQYDVYGRRVIAVDPDAISLGSEVIVRLADGYEFTAIALDIGGGINGREIDVLTESTERARGFGRQDVKIRIITEGDE